MEPIRVIVADDHPIVRIGVIDALNAQGFEVIGEAGSAKEAIALAIRLLPDVIILDTEMPDMDGVEAGKQIQQALPSVKILALSAHEDPVTMKDCLDAGFAGYLTKDRAYELLPSAIEYITNGS